MIGIEYASMFAALGTKVTVVEQRQRLLEFCDDEIIEALQYHLRDLGVIFRFGEAVTAVEQHRGRRGHRTSRAASGSPADAVLYSAGRQGATDGARPRSTPASRPTARGRIAVNERFRTAVRHIYAVGDVIGFPSLAATSMEQGRLAACDAFGVPANAIDDAAPDRHLHDPRDQLRRPHRGAADRGQRCRTRSASPATASSPAARSSATRTGMLKLLVSPDDRTHPRRARLRHRRHRARAHRPGGDGARRHGRLPLDTVFNYPTLAEAYKVAALDATNRLSAIERMAA